MSVVTSRFSGKVAIITASTAGIGLEIARRFLREGANVVVSSRKPTNVTSAIEELKHDVTSGDVTGIVCNVSKSEQRSQLIKHAVDKFGGIDILVCNAASNPVYGPLFETSESAWDKIMDTNVKSVFLLAKEAVPIMEKHGGGSLIIVSSIAAYNSDPNMGPYSISKTALLALTKAMSNACSPLNIRVNCVAPGLIKTKFSKVLWEDRQILEEAKREITLDRIGLPEECAGAVTFLASEDASYITGETIVVSGGMKSRL